MKTGIDYISAERERQVNEEGWTQDHDQHHDMGELSAAGAAYALADIYRRATSKGYNNTPHCWPFEQKWFKPTPEDRIKELSKAGALIAAEIDRLLVMQEGGKE